MSPAIKKTLFIIVKMLVSGLLLTYVFRKAGLEKVIAHLRDMNPWLFALSTVVYLLTLLISAARWRLLLRGDHRLGRLYSLTLIGAFFNNLLPGAVGGDAVKAYYLYKHTGKGGQSIASVFMDRYVGYVGLLFIGLLSGMVAFSDLRSIGMHLVTPLLFLAFVAGSLIVFGLRIGRRFSSISDFYDYFHDTVRDRKLMAKTLLLSLCVQVMTILMIWLIALGIGQHPSFAALFVFVPLIVTVTMIPVSISGLGIREGAFVLFFGLTGIPAEASATISVLWFLSIATGSLLGLVEYLRNRGQSGPGAAS